MNSAYRTVGRTGDGNGPFDTTRSHNRNVPLARTLFSVSGHDMDVSRLAAAFAIYDPHWLQVRHGDPHESVALVARLAREAPDDDHLCALGVALVAPLLDCHYESVFERFLEEAERNRNLRKATSCCYLRLPPDLDLLLTNLIADDDIGHSPA